MPDEMEKVINAQKKFSLDFDDAYQYVSAQKNELKLVSFDTDFDKTDLKRFTPSALLD